MEKILGKIRDRYRDARIVIGGDFNDNTPPNQIKELKRSSPTPYSRYNIKQRANTTIDHFYATDKLDIGSLVILRKKNEIENEG